MMKNNYQNLMEHINTPAGLNDRVLFAARQQAAERTAIRTGPKRLAPGKARPILRGAVCAACALALVVGTVRFYPAESQPESPVGQEDGPTVMVPGFSFGLTAYAADTGETYAPGPNSGIAFRAGEGCVTLDGGNYTGLLFRVTGEHIETLSLSIDRGGLYRYQLHENLTDEEMAGFRQAMAEGRLTTAAISQTDDGMWYMPEMTALGQSVQEDYDPEMSYGFWLSPEEMTTGSGLGITIEEQMDIDYFDGAILTVTAAFSDGTEQTRTYQLSSGPLRVEQYVTGGLTLLPQLAGDNEPFIYGLYAESEEDSRWLEWPVQGSNTVSLSYPYGAVKNGAVHSGIDIPALQGTVILAAADGTVKETGFDAERGNYLVLDHGDGLETVYAACRDFTVEEGDTVSAGEMIGAVGSTGMSTGPHLCFQVWQDDEAQNPVAYFDSEIRDTLKAE